MGASIKAKLFSCSHVHAFESLMHCVCFSLLNTSNSNAYVLPALAAAVDGGGGVATPTGCRFGKTALKGRISLGLGATIPADMINLNASSTVISKRYTSVSGTNKKNPEVGLGVVGRKIETNLPFPCKKSVRLVTNAKQ